jgi:soluble lytic murein transglycosylase-like protein
LQGEYLATGTKHRSSSIGRKKAEHVLHPIVIQAASRHQVDPALIKAIIMAESGYNTRAISKRGAKGLMQLMPATAHALGVEDAFNPKQNISGGVRYFKQLVTQFDGDVKLALAAYNAGSRNVRYYQGIPPFKATRYYIKKVFKYYEIYKDQMACAENNIVFLDNSNRYS